MVPKGTVNAVGVEDRRQFFDHAPIPVQCLAPDGTVLHANQALLDLLGYAHADYVGLHVSEVHADLEVAADILSVLAKRDRLTDCPARLRCQDGSNREVLISSHAYWKGDQFAHTHCFVREITREHRAERGLTISETRLAKMIQHLPDAMAITTLEDGRFLAVNHAYLRMIGRQGQDIVGKTSLELGRWPRSEDRETFVRQLVRDGRVRDVEATLGYPGQFRDCLVSAEISEFDGERYIVAVTKDITDRKRAEAALHETEAELRQAHKLEVVGRLAGGVAHDFNNLLSIVVGHSAMLMSGLATHDPLRSHVAAISRAADRATTLTQQLLAFSRRDIVRPRVFNLNDTVTQIQQLLPRLIGESIRVVINIDPAIANIRADPNQVEHVLMNLAVNARDAMPNGGTLRFATTHTTFDAAFVRHAHPAQQAGAYVVVSVSDTGQGMDAAAAAQVFEPFYTTKARGKGTGLGLATVYGIVKQAGGYIDLETAPGRGSTFTVSFPQVDAVEDPIESAPSATGPVTGTETVLVVEDEDEVRALFHEGLTALGYTVLTACDGLAALEICGGDVSIDVVLTDVVMPGMSGRELSGHLTERYPGLKTIFISGYADDILEPQGLLAVKAHLLRKPCTPDDAARLIRHVLDGTVGTDSWGNTLGARQLPRGL